jgi:hypothetical protein
MEPRIVPRIEAADYEEFRGLIDDLPGAFESWSAYHERLLASRGEEVKAQVVTPDQLRDRLRGNQDPVSLADLFRCARFLWYQNASRQNGARQNAR